jgi:glycerophosphoryl diester phosphodiesterase
LRAGDHYVVCMTRRWLRVAHRGASGTAPEHTRPAFERALAAGVDMIELDVQLSRDGELVVIHDSQLERTTNGHGAVRDHEAAALKALDAGSWFDARFAGEPLLTLDDVLVLVGARARLNVELKAPAADWQVLAARLLRTLHAHGALETTVVSGFAPEALAAVRAQGAPLALALLWQDADFTAAWRWAETLPVRALHPYWALASAALVAEAHRRGLQVLAWTVNDTAVMRDLVAAGIDGIMSDFPERFASVAPAGSAA